jgi:hypothetical protein
MGFGWPQDLMRALADRTRLSDEAAYGIWKNELALGLPEAALFGHEKTHFRVEVGRSRRLR